MRNSVIFILLTFGGHAGRCQPETCLNEVIAFEQALGAINDSIPNGKTIVYCYKVKAVNQDDEVTESSVKVYSDGVNMNVFSDHASIYRNDNEAVMVMPEQKLLVINDNTPEINRLRVSDAFLALRLAFLKSCRVVECTELYGQHHRLILEATTAAGGKLHIRRLTYEFDRGTKSIISIKTDYDANYKLKHLSIYYRPTEWLDNYVFTSPYAQCSDKKGRLLARYSDYEVVDNRDKATRMR